LGKENLYLLGGHHQSGHSSFLVVHIHIHILVEEIQHTACNGEEEEKKGVTVWGNSEVKCVIFTLVAGTARLQKLLVLLGEFGGRRRLLKDFRRRL